VSVPDRVILAASTGLQGVLRGQGDLGTRQHPGRARPGDPRGAPGTRPPRHGAQPAEACGGGGGTGRL